MGVGRSVRVDRCAVYVHQLECMYTLRVSKGAGKVGKVKLSEVPDEVDIVRWKTDDRERWRYHYAVRVREGAGTYWHSTVGAQLYRDPETALGVTSYIRNTSPGYSDDVEPLVLFHDRPSTCCGACPRILNGGYDCTCEHNPRCPNYIAPPFRKRFVRALERWLRIDERVDD